jgi:hypothetical protein
MNRSPSYESFVLNETDKTQLNKKILPFAKPRTLREVELEY